MAYLAGEWVGAIFGMALLGSGLAWCIRRFSRIGWEVCFVTALVAIAIVAGFTNSNETRGYLSTVLMYATAGIPAYFLASALRSKSGGPSSSRLEPAFGATHSSYTDAPTLGATGGPTPIRNLNWRRGFFRIWAVLALIWLAFVGLIFYSQIVTPYVPAKAVATTKGAAAPGLFDTYGEPYNSWSTAASKGELLATNVRPGYSLFTVPTLSGAELALQINAARRVVDDYLSATVSERRSSAIASFAAMALIPSAVILVLGWLAGWALSGFVRK
jgi:hypothetical protein